MTSNTTAPMTATMKLPKVQSNGVSRPVSRLKRKPATNAPMMPTMMLSRPASSQPCSRAMPAIMVATITTLFNGLAPIPQGLYLGCQARARDA